VRPRIPIYNAALGEKNVELTAEIADGWLPLFYLPERARDVFGASLDAGAAKRSPDLGPLDICAGGLCCVGEFDEVKGVLDMFARPMAALYIGGMGAKGRNFYNALVTRYGYEQEAAEIQDLYLAGKKEEAAAKVPDALLELTNLCGPEGFIKERIAAFKEAGVTVLNVTPIAPDPAKLIEQLKTWTS
jgi:alkanesulfonate monooxygenase SsuD/methylene tetrahydromethanopterin reductase-like flavin-dependent oxidoreductase (luciferase family)